MQDSKHAVEPVAVYSKVRSIEEDGEEDVYCMNVPSHGNFVVNKGVVVKNCLDSLRYAIYTHMFAKDTKGMSSAEYDRMRQEAFGGQPDLPEFFRDPTEYPQGFRPLI